MVFVSLKQGLRTNPLFWLALAVLVASGDLHAWRLGDRTAAAQNATGLFFKDINKWMPDCWNSPGQGKACHVVLSFPFQSADGDERYAFLGFSKNNATLTAPIEKFTIMSWRVDEHPFVDTLSIEGDGAVLSHSLSAKLILQMLTGTRLQVRFVEYGTGRKIERSFPLNGFWQAYARYQECQETAHITGCLRAKL